MKIISGSTSSGKTTTVAEKAAEYSRHRIRSLILSGEATGTDYLPLLDKAQADFEYVSVIHVRSMHHALMTLLTLEHDVVFLDSVIQLMGRGVWEGSNMPQVSESNLKFLQGLEEYTGNTFYVTLQTRRDKTEENKVTVWEYTEDVVNKKPKEDTFKVSLVYYDDLTEEEQHYQPDNGHGKKNAHYIKIVDGDETVSILSDAVEPEDATFYRDFSGVLEAIRLAYKLGLRDGSSSQ